MLADTAARLINEVQYKPGWRITAKVDDFFGATTLADVVIQLDWRSLDTSQAAHAWQAKTWGGEPDYGPPQMFHYTLRLEGSQLQQMSTVEDLYHWLFSRLIMTVELHEAREFFRVSREGVQNLKDAPVSYPPAGRSWAADRLPLDRPDDHVAVFHPHDGDGTDRYRNSSRWERTEAL